MQSLEPCWIAVVIDKKFESEDNYIDLISCASRFMILLGLIPLLEAFDLLSSL